MGSPSDKKMIKNNIVQHLAVRQQLADATFFTKAYSPFFASATASHHLPHPPTRTPGSCPILIARRTDKSSKCSTGYTYGQHHINTANNTHTDAMEWTNAISLEEGLILARCLSFCFKTWYARKFMGGRSWLAEALLIQTHNVTQRKRNTLTRNTRPCTKVKSMMEYIKGKTAETAEIEAAAAAAAAAICCKVNARVISWASEASIAQLLSSCRPPPHTQTH